MSVTSAKFAKETGPVIVVEDLRKRYGDIQAVDGVSFQVERGEVFALLGPNGSGKTTTIEIIEGMRSADSGRATVAGIDVSKNPKAVKQLVGVQLQSSAFFEHLKLAELLKMLGSIYRVKVDPVPLLEAVDLAERKSASFRTLSGGQKQRFAIAASLVNNPDVVFLDEPTTGLDPQARRLIWDLAKTWKQEGRTVVLTTHYMEEAEELCDRVAVMDNGKIIVSASPVQLIDQLISRGFHREQEVRLATLEDVFLDLTGPVAAGSFRMFAKPAVYLTWWSIKMWSRDRAAMFWTFFLPLVIMVIFGLLNFGELGKVDLGIVDLAGNEASSQFIDGLSEIDALRIETGTAEDERAALADGKRDLVILLPVDLADVHSENQIVALYHGEPANRSAAGVDGRAIRRRRTELRHHRR